MAYLTEDQPERGVAIEIAPGIRRITAANPGPMTYHGTNTYLIDAADGTWVLDPGPEDAAHLAAVLAAAGRVSGIVVSHIHHDHVAGLPAMRAATGAPVYAYSETMTPDRILRHGDVLGDWTALHTPGHAADHLCFARADGVVFTADHVMGWSSSIVPPPPRGDMTDYFASLRLLLARSDRVYLPGHGPAISTPQDYTSFLLNHRQGREDAIMAGLERGPQSLEALVGRLYARIGDNLRAAATRNVQAHLHKLEVEGKAVERDGAWAIPPTSTGPAA